MNFENAIESIVKSDDQFPVDFDLAWEWIGYGRRDHALVALERMHGLDFSCDRGESNGGRPRASICLTVPQRVRDGWLGNMGWRHEHRKPMEDTMNLVEYFERNSVEAQFSD